MPAARFGARIDTFGAEDVRTCSWVAFTCTSAPLRMRQVPAAHAEPCCPDDGHGFPRPSQ
eukprot:10855096-Alexandrium_andersonii.AAC.1